VAISDVGEGHSPASATEGIAGRSSASATQAGAILIIISSLTALRHVLRQSPSRSINGGFIPEDRKI
jgi:hypothetical protein